MTHKVPKNLRIVSDVPILVTNPSSPSIPFPKRLTGLHLQAWEIRRDLSGEYYQLV